MTLLKAGLKRDSPGKHAEVEIQSFIRSSVQLIGYKCKMDPVMFGLKGISADHGRDIRLSQPSFTSSIAAANMNNTAYKTMQDPSSRKVLAKLTICPTCPLPISISTYEPGHDNGGDLGGIGMGVLPTTNDDDVHKNEVTNISALASTIQSTVSYYDPVTATNLPISRVFWPASGHHVAVDSQGNIWAAWTMARTATINSVYYAKSINGGNTWTVGRIDSTYAGYQTGANVVVDENDTVHFAWVQYSTFGTTTNSVQYRNVTSAGVWSSVTAISTLPDALGQQRVDPCLQVLPDGLSLGAVWSMLKSTNKVDLMYNMRSSGGTWGTESAITTNTSATIDYRNPGLDYDANSKPHLICIYADRTNGLPSDVYYTNKIGANWAAMTQINTEYPGFCYTACNIVVDLRGKIHVLYVYFYNDGALSSLEYKQYMSGTWTVAETVDADTGYFAGMQIDNEGNAHFIYAGNDGTGRYVGKTRTRYNR